MNDIVGFVFLLCMCRNEGEKEISCLPSRGKTICTTTPRCILCSPFL